MNTVNTTSQVYTDIAYFLFVSHRVGSMNTGWPYVIDNLMLPGVDKKKKRYTNDNCNPGEMQVAMWEVEAAEVKEQDWGL